MEVIPLPRWTADAKKRWDEVPQWIRKRILAPDRCAHCGAMRPLRVSEARMVGRTLLLEGVCRECGGKVARMIEPDEE